MRKIEGYHHHPPGAGIALTLLFGMAACGGGASDEGGLSGSVQVDGSSTVYPITEAIAEEFQRDHPGTRVTVGISGTGGGFKRFCGGEIDVSDASRPIKDSESALCAENGIRFTEIRIAWDGLSVVTNPSNDFVDCLTTDELKRIWEPGSEVDNWRDVRQTFPDKELVLYGPGTDSGTFDYFTEAIVGQEDASRPDYTASEDDNVLVQGVIADPGALGYFGYAYYEENADRLKVLGVDGGGGCITPSVETIENQTYAPLSRPLYLYVSDQGIAKPQVEAFVEFALTEGAELVRSVGYIPLQPEQYEAEMDAVRRLTGGAPASPADTAAAPIAPPDTANAP
ncbi:MAG TPA: PstS family phosphate ABC transporter substrate-binding protein [Gemmatimonadota bacterium]|nr:PstS family phosphate ABC transporter substrate-binding protein [Gemmatimonadota bacterium]